MCRSINYVKSRDWVILALGAMLSNQAAWAKKPSQVAVASAEVEAALRRSYQDIKAYRVAHPGASLDPASVSRIAYQELAIPERKLRGVQNRDAAEFKRRIAREFTLHQYKDNSTKTEQFKKDLKAAEIHQAQVNREKRHPSEAWRELIRTLPGKTQGPRPATSVKPEPDQTPAMPAPEPNPTGIDGSKIETVVDFPGPEEAPDTGDDAETPEPGAF